MIIATALRPILLCAALFGLIACQSMATPHRSANLDRQVLDSIAEPVEPVFQTGLGREIAPGVDVPEPDLWREIRAGFALTRHLDQPRVQQELRWLAKHPKYLENLAPRLERHLAFIHREVRERSLPSEIALLPIVESALDPYAFSHGGAAGLWQFIPSTAKRYGLDRNWWYDGRRDPVASTGAALDYLEDLHARFDDWSLALAGYNAGEGNVERARRRAAENASFWQLKLPRETSAYVPRLLALAELVAHPEKYGVALPPLDPGIPFHVVATGSQIDLGVVAEATRVDLDTLYRWNPALNQWSTPPAGPHRLLLPVEFGAAAEQAIATVPANERVRWMRIEVRNGDTLSGLAKRHHTDVASIRKANGLSGNQIRTGQTLLIPRSNHALANPVAARSSGATYVVKPGDSLWSISKLHDVPVTTLMKANRVGPQDYLTVGQQLTVPGAAASPRNAEIRKVRYGVRKGDSLARIAQKFNVSTREIVSWNKLDVSKYLQPGQLLLLYVDTTAPAGD